MPKLDETKQQLASEVNNPVREEIIQQTTQRFLDYRCQKDLKAKLRQGYKDMSLMNLTIAEEYHEAENEATIKAEATVNGN